MKIGQLGQQRNFKPGEPKQNRTTIQLQAILWNNSQRLSDLFLLATNLS
jgi:hypothetical protein